MPEGALVAVMLLVGAASALAASYQAGGVRVSAAWSRATYGAGASGVGYMVIDNAGAADALTGATCTGAQTTALHAEKSGTMTMPGMAAMRTDSMTLLDRIDIPKGGQVRLQPGGLHLMLMDMTQGLSVGQSVPCVLQFRDAGALRIELAVGRAGAATAPKVAH